MTDKELDALEMDYNRWHELSNVDELDLEMDEYDMIEEERLELEGIMIDTIPQLIATIRALRGGG